jgi:iron complex outermembrane receptor protein
VAGVDVEDWDYLSLRSQSLETLGAPAARITASQRNVAFYVQHNSELFEATKLSLGARQQRVDMNVRDEINPAAYASGRKVSKPTAWELGLRHALDAATAVHGKVGQSFRVATVDEGYSQFGGPFFDAIVTLLEPQTSRNAEIGIDRRTRTTHARASLWRYDLRNEIHFFAPTFSNINLPPTERRGLELDASHALTPRLSAFANIAFVQARFREGMLGGVDVAGKTVPLVPRRTAGAGFSWKWLERTSVSAAARYVGPQRYDNDQANTFPGEMPSYWTADLQVAQELGRLRLRAAVRNLLDRKYFSYGIRNAAGTSFNAYPQPERHFVIDAEYRL